MERFSLESALDLRDCVGLLDEHLFQLFDVCWREFLDGLLIGYSRSACNFSVVPDVPQIR